MTQEEQDLVSIAIAAYYPYGLMCELDDSDEPMMLDSIKYHDTYCFVGVFERYITQFKPYLRPMSSITEEEKADWSKAVDTQQGKSLRRTPFCTRYMDWLNKHFFDYRHLIEKGLALKAKEGMYNEKGNDEEIQD